MVIISKDFHNKQTKSQLRINDILMVQSGHVGECAVVDETFEESNCHALIIMTPSNKVHSPFFVNYFYSNEGKRRIFKITTGNTIKHILASDIKELNVCVPDYAEQVKIGEFFTSFDKLVIAQEHKLDMLKVHKKGLMQGLFPVINENE